MQQQPPSEPWDSTLAHTYSAKELEQYADELLLANSKEIDPETGKERGIGGESPILFYNHLKAREKREIKTGTGTVDDNLTVNERGQPGMYNRQSPNGRKVNSPEQRRKNGASFYR